MINLKLNLKFKTRMCHQAFSYTWDALAGMTKAIDNLMDPFNSEGHIVRVMLVPSSSQLMPHIPFTIKR